MFCWSKLATPVLVIRMTPAVSLPTSLPPVNVTLGPVPPTSSESSGLVITSVPLFTVLKSSPTVEPTAAVWPARVRVPLMVRPGVTSRPFRV